MIWDIMKRLGYYMFNIFYYIFYLFPINKNKMLLIMTHDVSSEGNILYSFNYFKSKNPVLFFKKITKELYDFKIDGKLMKKIINFFIFTPYHVATSKMIFLDNIFLPFAYTKFKKDVAVVQLWHGTGSIKKFALDSETGLIKELAIRSNSKNTHLLVGSENMVPVYQTAFKMDRKKIFPIGLPRTDIFFNKRYIRNKEKEFYEKYPELFEKKIVLYAPTFRDESFKSQLRKNKKLDLDDNLNLNLKIFDLFKYLDEDYVLILKLHPAVSKHFSLEKLSLNPFFKDKIRDFSDFNSLNSIMIVSDCIITDYSSIIFEYSLLGKKMIFYPYDLEDFESYSRGFYFDYKEFVPGDICLSIEEISKKIKDKINNEDQIILFKNKYMEKCDGKSTERLQLILNNFGE